MSRSLTDTARSSPSRAERAYSGFGDCRKALVSAAARSTSARLGG